jgi:hypothetical protein
MAGILMEAERVMRELEEWLESKRSALWSSDASTWS